MTSDRCIKELCVNFVARMTAAGMHKIPNINVSKRQDRETRMIEFFTGAYVALRHMGRKNEAEELGIFTATILAKVGYSACCAAAGLPAPIVGVSMLHKQ